MGKCEADVFNHLNCHYVGPVLLEGSSYTNPPDIYFKFYPIRHVCQRAGGILVTFGTAQTQIKQAKQKH